MSSEVGCQMGCTFCATGTMGLKGDLTAGEIVEQLWHARSVTSIRNVVFMVRKSLVVPALDSPPLAPQPALLHRLVCTSVTCFPTGIAASLRVMLNMTTASVVSAGHGRAAEQLR